MFSVTISFCLYYTQNFYSYIAPKVATGFRSILNNTTDDGGFGISEEEKAQLLSQIDKIQEENK